MERRTSDTFTGRVLEEERALTFVAASADAWAGEVELRVGSRVYEVDYDYVAGRVVTDGQGVGLDRPTAQLLSDAVRLVEDYLGENNPALPFHEQMLFAALVTWQGSGGMPLGRRTFALDPEEVTKSLGNDAVTCIRSGQSYLVSFDHDETTVIDRTVTAGESNCNGRCGPSCSQLQPWAMWTLDCLEHDECCRDTNDPLCWTPLGDCGDEYADAEVDFLRGFDPFRGHCGG
ncbi:MAG TPA: hypothetical protein VJU61_14430 [Polyangiaceae bacterium]|nr:hypothetical protein [Polyangiaceae bacterium]